MAADLTAAWQKRRDMIVHNTAPVNAEPPARVLAANEITASEAFYCRNHGAIPDIAPAHWRLTVDGADALSYADLTTGFPAHEVTATLECAGNRRAELLRVRSIPGKEPWAQGAISTAVWRGARLGDVLRANGIGKDTGMHVAFVAPDIAPEATPPQPYGSSIPIDKALADEVLLAWAMNGEPLPRLHGGPVRVVVPGFIGARSVKWITGVTVQPAPSQNYFQAVDYRLLSPGETPEPGAGIAMSTLRLNCAILTPDDGATVPAGMLQLCGYAVADDSRRIARVEVSVDGENSWQPAVLTSPLSPWAWRHWSLEIGVDPGPLAVTARAVDDTGATHPESAAALWNPAGYANNAWSRVDVAVQPAR